ncbi:hypothetical protein V8E54_000882 [Elaphomyces granulatus]
MNVRRWILLANVVVLRVVWQLVIPVLAVPEFVTKVREDATPVRREAAAESTTSTVVTTTAATGFTGSTFQVLTDGTQDLAALIGLFATDSVEQYSFDFTTDFISPAMATCSMLGTLGYVRALLKLALGPE